MNQLVQWLHLPSGDAVDLGSRLVRAGATLLLSLTIAWLVGRLAAAWVRRLGVHRDTPLGEALARTTARNMQVFVSLIGIYYAIVELHPGDRVLPIVAATTYVLAAAVALRLLRRVATGFLRSYFDHRARDAEGQRIEKEYLPLTSSLATLAITLIVIITVAHHFGHDVNSLIAALGVGSLAIGLAAQQSLGNMIAGFTLLIDRPFRPGDRIRLATGETGEVTDIGIRSTRILLDDDNQLIVPNTELANSRVLNFAFPTPWTRCEVHLPVAAAEVETWSDALVELARAQPSVLANPPPVVRLLSISDGAQELALWFHVAHHAQKGAAEDGVRRAILRRRLEDRGQPAAAPATPPEPTGSSGDLLP